MRLRPELPDNFTVLHLACSRAAVQDIAEKINHSPLTANWQVIALYYELFVFSKS